MIKISKTGIMFVLLVLFTFGTAFAKPVIFKWVYPRDAEKATTGFIIKNVDRGVLIHVGVSSKVRKVEVDTPLVAGDNTFEIASYKIQSVNGKMQKVPTLPAKKVVIKYEPEVIEVFTAEIKKSAVVR